VSIKLNREETYVETVGATAISDTLLSLLELSKQHKVSRD
jgi:hypothetical protein